MLRWKSKFELERMKVGMVESLVQVMGIQGQDVSLHRVYT